MKVNLQWYMGMQQIYKHGSHLELKNPYPFPYSGLQSCQICAQNVIILTLGTLSAKITRPHHPRPRPHHPRPRPDHSRPRPPLPRLRPLKHNFFHWEYISTRKTSFIHQGYWNLPPAECFFMPLFSYFLLPGLVVSIEQSQQSSLERDLGTSRPKPLRDETETRPITVTLKVSM